MYLNYSKIEFDQNGNPESPELILKTIGGQMIGSIPGVSGLKLGIKYAEPSSISFDVASIVDDQLNWIYDSVTGYKIIYTKSYGVYVTMNPSESADGISNIKHIEGFSIEYLLNTKKFLLEEGTFKFYDQTNKWNPDTVIGRILEVAPDWNVGYIAPTIAQKYRTFDQYDNYLLPFMYGDAMEKYRCIFVFDPYLKEFSVYDADIEQAYLPIYLDFDNLLDSVDVDELSEEIITAIRPYGADELDIRGVNPIGTNWLYNLDWFISNGDLPEELAAKWNDWQLSIANNREYYMGLVSLQASTTAQLTAAQAQLTELENDLGTLQTEQSVTIQAIALENTDSGKAIQETNLQNITAQIEAQEALITEQTATIQALQDQLDATNPGSYAASIRAIVNRLAIQNYFDEDELAILSNYFIEQDITEETFVASTVDTTVSGKSYSLLNSTVLIQDSDIAKIDLENYEAQMYSFAGGAFAIGGSQNVSGDIIRGTLEVHNDLTFILSFYAGSILVGTQKTQSGIVTVSGALSSLSHDVEETDIDGVPWQKGTTLSFTVASAPLFLTANVSDYQKYAVETELLEFALDVLEDVSSPTYEFSINSGNFIFSSEFVPFRNQLQLGQGIYLNLGKEIINPKIIEFELDFENRESFSLVFSNRFKRFDNTNKYKEQLKKSYSYSRSFDANKYIYGKTVDQASSVSRFMNESWDSAKNSIIAARDQSVIINSAGISITSTDDADSYLKQFELRMTNGMIAFTKDKWHSADVAIGVFKTANGYHTGVNAQVVAGNLIVGNNCIIENQQVDAQGHATGVMQFKVDASGAWLYNSTFTLAKDDGGKILIDPRWGIAAGMGDLYNTSGTTVYPSFVDEDDEIEFDSEGMPKNSNFFLDIQDGNAYFRGTILAKAGLIGGFSIEESYLHSGGNSNFVALNGSNSNEYSIYALWAGAADPNNAPFWVKKDGSFKATDGDFSGTITAAQVVNLSAAENGGWIVGCGIAVPSLEAPAFMVDQDGNVTLKGNITWTKDSAPKTSQYSEYDPAVTADRWMYWHDTMTEDDQWKRDWDWSLNDGNGGWGEPYRFRGEELTFDSVNGALGDFFNQYVADGNATTFISDKLIASPTVYGGTIYGAQFYAGIGNNAMARVLGDGFYLYERESGDTDFGIKAALRSYTGASSTRFVSLTLGVGSSISNNYGTFQLYKSFIPASASGGLGNVQSATINYYTGSGKVTGIQFDDDGNLSFLGLTSGGATRYINSIFFGSVSIFNGTWTITASDGEIRISRGSSNYVVINYNNIYIKGDLLVDGDIKYTGEVTKVGSIS